MEREIIWTLIGGNLCALIPKKRGRGFLKQPYGHHIDPELEGIRHQLGGVDLFGLDGHLEVDIHRIRDTDRFEATARKALTLLEAHYDYPSRESRTDFWHHHPAQKTVDNA